MDTPDELAALREDVLSRINRTMLGCSARGVSLLQRVERAVIRSDEVLAEVAALRGLRPSEGLFNGMEAILRDHPGADR